MNLVYCCDFSSMGENTSYIVSLEKVNTVKLQWLEHLWDYENLFETGEVRAIEGLL